MNFICRPIDLLLYPKTAEKSFAAFVSALLKQRSNTETNQTCTSEQADIEGTFIWLFMGMNLLLGMKTEAIYMDTP